MCAYGSGVTLCASIILSPRHASQLGVNRGLRAARADGHVLARARLVHLVHELCRGAHDEQTQLEAYRQADHQQQQHLKHASRIYQYQHRSFDFKDSGH